MSASVGVRYQGAFEGFELEDVVNEQRSLPHRLQCNAIRCGGKSDCRDVRFVAFIGGQWQVWVGCRQSSFMFVNIPMYLSCWYRLIERRQAAAQQMQCIKKGNHSCSCRL
jgi:hypothetical protein